MMDQGGEARSPGVLPGGRTFLVVWLGQLVSLVGSALTLFGLPIWLFLETGSATQLAALLLVQGAARTAASPFVGVLVDRWDRRRAMMVSDAGAGVATLIIAVLLSAGSLEAWHLYPITAVAAFFQAFQFPAYSAAVTLLVPPSQLGRAAGFAELAESVSRVAGPFLAGLLLAGPGLEAVLYADVATFLVALTTLAVVRFPRPAPSEAGAAAAGSMLAEARFGIRYLTGRRGLLALVVFIAVISLLMAFVNVLIFPLILEFSSEAAFGASVSIAALALVVGSLVMSAWGGPRRRVRGVVAFTVPAGLGLIVMGLRPNLGLVTAGLVMVFLVVPFINGSSQALFQTKVAPDVQGRVFSIRRLFAEAAALVGYAVAGPLADAVFEPLLAANGALAGTVGDLLGTGPGRGIALLFVALGLATLGAVAAAWVYRPLRTLESDLPDIDPPTQPAPAEPGAS